MIELKVTQSADPTAAQLTQFKQYASIADTNQDAMLTVLLKQAMLKVQEASNKGLLICGFELTISGVALGEPVRLYQGASTVTSCKDVDGIDVEYVLEGDRLIPKRSCAFLKIVYTNAVSESEVSQLAPVVWQYATALYDGAEPKDQAAILQTCYSLI